jgi:hypothetical protein
VKNLPKWYPGDLKAIAATVAAEAGLTFFWLEQGYAENIVHYIEAPFAGPENYHTVVLPRWSNRWMPPEDKLIVVRYGSAKEAANAVLKWGLPIGDAILPPLGLGWVKKG